MVWHATRGFEFVEWDEAETPGLDASEYSISGGHVNVSCSVTSGHDLFLARELFLAAGHQAGCLGAPGSCARGPHGEPVVPAPVLRVSWLRLSLFVSCCFIYFKV